jgi:hypothetical protein
MPSFNDPFHFGNAVASADRLFGRAIQMEINTMSTSIVALGVGIVTTVYKLKPAWTTGKWNGVFTELRSRSWKGVMWAGLCWVALFPFVFTAAIYEDHVGLVQAGRGGKQAIDKLNADINQLSRPQLRFSKE